MAKPVQIVSDDNSSLISDDLSGQGPTSLTHSEDSDTTRVYDIDKRETKILRHEIIKTSRYPIAAAVTPPSSPIDWPNIEHLNFKQVREVKRAYEERQALIKSAAASEQVPNTVKRSPSFEQMNCEVSVPPFLQLQTMT